eukprot:263118-Rhodomonas_salina.3
MMLPGGGLAATESNAMLLAPGLSAYVSAMRCPVLTDCMLLSKYASAMRCPVLTEHLFLPAYKNSVRFLVLTSRMVLWAYARAMRCPVLTWRVVLLGVPHQLRITGTTLSPISARPPMRSPVLTRSSAYERAMRCPVYAGPSLSSARYCSYAGSASARTADPGTSWNHTMPHTVPHTVRYYTTPLPPYAHATRCLLSCTDLVVYGTSCLQACYAMSGTDLVYAATRTLGGISSGAPYLVQNSDTSLSTCYAMSGTDLV